MPKGWWKAETETVTAVPSSEASRYGDAATQVAIWLSSTAVEAGGGLAWPARPSVDNSLVPSLGWGSLGPVVFFADLYRFSGDPQLRDLGQAGAVWIRTWLHWPPEVELPPGLFTGLGGFAIVFNELQRAGIDTRHDLAQVFDRLISMATRTGAGTQWWETTEVLWGTAGIGFLLLSIGRAVMGDEAVEVAAQAGDWLLSVACPVEEGLRWDMGERPLRQRPHLATKWFPNFAHGTAGIAAFLARLARITGEERYLQSAERGAAWVLSRCRTDDGTCAAAHHELSRPGDFGIGPVRGPDDASPLYTLGWCHGPPGLGYLFRELQLVTGADEWGEWIRRTARAVRRSGIPERREPGFWDNLGRCCGSAGVAEYYLDLHHWRGEPDDLHFAGTILDDLLGRATLDDSGMRWSNVECRRERPELPPETTWLQGASGIGCTLIRAARELAGDRSTVELPHVPQW